jgi:hypothetical protein
MGLLKMENERRRHPRFECEGRAAVQVAPYEHPCPASIANLSLEGCLVLLEKPRRLTMDALVELAFNVNQLPFRVRGQVKAVRSSTKVGFQFHQVSRRMSLQLQDLIDELKQAAPRRDERAERLTVRVICEGSGATVQKPSPSPQL